MISVGRFEMVNGRTKLLTNPRIISMSTSRYKVGMLNLVHNCLKWTPRFEWRVIRCGSKNGHKKGMCLDNVGLCAQNVLTTLG